MFTLHLNSDAGYAVLLLTLLGAPVSIGRALGGLMPRLYCPCDIDSIARVTLLLSYNNKRQQPTNWKEA